MQDQNLVSPSHDDVYVLNIGGAQVSIKCERGWTVRILINIAFSRLLIIHFAILCYTSYFNRNHNTIHNRELPGAFLTILMKSSTNHSLSLKRIDVAHAIAADSVFHVTSTLQSACIPIKNKAFPTNWVCLKS